jgi:hypothetical protein
MLVYVRFTSSVTRVGDGGSDVTSVNTMLQQCTGKVVRLNIQSEITYNPTVVEFYTTMVLVVPMQRCHFVSAGSQKQRDISLYRQFIRGFRTHIT